MNEIVPTKTEENKARLVEQLKKTPIVQSPAKKKALGVRVTTVGARKTLSSQTLPMKPCAQVKASSVTSQSHSSSRP